MASLIDNITNFFIPRDNLRRQAQDVLDRFDQDRDGYINTAELQSNPAARAMVGMDANSIVAADYEGNANGKAGLKEIRNHFKNFDTGSAWNPYGADDKVLDGVEKLQMYQADSVYGPSYGGYGGIGFGFGVQGGFGVNVGFGANAGAGYGGFFRGGGGPSAASQAQSGAQRVA